MKRFLPLFAFFVCARSFGQNPVVDFTSLHAVVAPDHASRSIEGMCTYEFTVHGPADTIRIDAQKMQFHNVRVNGKAAGHTASAKQFKLFSGFRKGRNTLSFAYSATPSQTLYFTGSGDDAQFWTQGQGKYTSHWLPSFDDTNEKLVFNISVLYADGFDVLSNGKLHKKVEEGGKVRWDFRMEKPMSSYLAMIAGGKFASQRLQSASGVPQVLYFRPADRHRFEPTYRHSVRIFDFLEREIGVPYPWKVYRQVPVRDFLYAGMENTAATVFAQELVVDSIGFNDKNYINVNAHELAHQWFGDLVTAKSGEHHWLQEGFATYYALLAERDLFGDDHFYFKLYETASSLRQASLKDTVPILSTRASSLTYYQKGAWAVHVLRESLGAEKFRKGIKSYLLKYGFRNADTDDFLKEMQAASGIDLSDFKRDWLATGGFRFAQAISLLKKNGFMSRYFDLLDLSSVPLDQKKGVIAGILSSEVYHPLKEEALYQLENVDFAEKKDLIALAMKSGWEVRQAVARTLGKFPPDFYDEYRTLLDDNSFITQEIALNVLWSQFPEKRTELLQHTRGRVGFNDRNLEIQWLALALLTDGFDTGQKVAHYDRLLQLAGPGQESATRMNAINNLLYLSPMDTNVLDLLPSTLVHHKWQLTSFGREKIRLLLKKPSAREHFEKMLSALPKPEQAQLARLLDEK